MIYNKVHTFENGKWRQNCYIISSCDGRALIIDPGSDFSEIVKRVCFLNIRPVAILNTHAHYDHIGAVAELQKFYDIKFYLHADDELLLRRANVYKLLFESKVNLNVPLFDEAYPIEFGDVLEINGFSVKILHTPGHTAGSVCLMLGRMLFSGDTLLPTGPGRSDLPGGNLNDLKLSLMKLHNLPGDTTVYPGHGKTFDLQTFFQKYDV